MQKLDMEINELSQHKVTYETCVGGQHYETIYIVYSEEESFIGYRVDDGFPTRHLETSPTGFGWDGHLYVSKTSEEEVIEKIGKEMLDHHIKRMRAIEVLWNHEFIAERIAESMLPKVECIDCGTKFPKTEEAEVIKVKEGYLCDRCSFGRNQ